MARDIDIDREILNKLPTEDQDKLYVMRSLNNLFLGLVKMSSIRFELGIMSSDEARALLDFAYAPIRVGLGNITWQNKDKDLPSPRVWSYDDYHTALGKLSGRFKFEEPLPEQ